jgi:hypothetical protein
MKKTHIVALVLIAVAIATLISFMGDVPPMKLLPLPNKSLAGL